MTHTPHRTPHRNGYIRNRFEEEITRIRFALRYQFDVLRKDVDSRWRVAWGTAWIRTLQILQWQTIRNEKMENAFATAFFVVYVRVSLFVCDFMELNAN